MFYAYLIFYILLAGLGYYLKDSDYDSTIRVVIAILLILWVVNIWWKNRAVNCQLSPQQRQDGLIALLNIRYAELGSIYHCVNNYKIKCNGDSWIPTFLTDYSSVNDDYSDEIESVQTKRVNRRKLKAHQLYHRRFKKNPFYGRWEDSELSSLGIALLYWSSCPRRQIRLLTSIPCDAALRKHIRSLTREYRLIDVLTLCGKYTMIFSNWLPFSHIARERYSRLRREWAQLWQSVTLMIATSQCAHMANPKSESMVALQYAWEQCACLAEMENYLNGALSQEKSEFSGGPSPQTEEKFFNILRSNPIWKNFDGYISPKETSLKELT
jgi:hypothetical protein